MDLISLGYCGVACNSCADLQSGKCPGCRKTVWPADDPCPPVACCRKKGILVCGMCSRFPCQMMSAFYAESDSHWQARQRMEILHRRLRG